jgi:2-methylcitrate dehydratase PrpD
MTGTKQVGATSDITGCLARYAASALAKPLPEVVAERARLHLLDTVASMISGSRLPAGLAALRYIGDSSEGPVCVPGTPLRLPTLDAVLVSAMAAHADETDDTHAASLTHPGSVVVPAALAVAQMVHASGAETLCAVVLGYDMCCRMSLALGAYDFFGRGFDTHAFGGVFGSVAAAGALLRLDETRFRFALSYAAQQCAGLATWRRDPDHIEKAFDFAGMPARNGVQAAMFVASGMTGVSDVFDGKPSFFTAFGAAQPDLAISALGERFEVAHTSIKKWCVATPAQAPLDGLAAIMCDHGLTGQDITAITAVVGATGARVVTGSMPNVNAEHLLALLAVDGALTFDSSHDVARMSDPRVREMRGRVTIEPSEAMGLGRDAVVLVRTRDGRSLRHHALHVRGTPDNAMERSEVVEKAIDLIQPILGDRSSALIAALLEVESVPDMRKLGSLLQSNKSG